MPLDIDIGRLSAKSVRLRLVRLDDAEYILSLRTDGTYNKYLSAVGADVDAQRAWLESYKKEEAAGKQYYFIVERVADGCRCGTVRVYDLLPDSFSWGSWILDSNKTAYAAVEVALLVYRFGFDVLGFGGSHFEVMKGNDKVISFHEKFGARRVSEDEVNMYFIYKKEAFHSLLPQYARFLV